MSYLFFLILFIGLPLLILSAALYRSESENKLFNLKGILILALAAMLYTTPWDNYLVANKVWWYGPDRVFAVIGYVPVEEYMFFILQTFMTGLWSVLVFDKFKISEDESKSTMQWIGILFVLISTFVGGVFCLFNTSSFYLGLILAWATPIVILQYIIGGRHTLKNINIFLYCTIPPTLYLWAADYYAIQDGIWEISKEYTIGIQVGVLPVEEMVFFLVTNIMVVQGLLLFNAMKSKYKFLKGRL